MAVKLDEFDGFCVLDEADPVLMNEEHTPLIISKQLTYGPNVKPVSNGSPHGLL